jgi:hypothetical protein
MIKIGNCKLCGASIYWSFEHDSALFCNKHCACEIPYPKEFMDWWTYSGSPNIQNDYTAWEAGIEYATTAIKSQRD